MTPQQENRSVLFTLANTVQFTLELNATPGKSGRNILFAGEAEFSTPTQVTTVPEPSATALLGLIGFGCIFRRRRS